MSLASSSVSITRYNVQGQYKSRVIDTIADGLKRHAIADIDQQVADKAVGWTSFDKPFQPDFGGSAFVYGNYFVFSLRIDKKNIAAKVLKKHYTIEAARRMAESGRDFLSKAEKKMIKDHVLNSLSLRIPATPNIYDVVWNYEAASLWFFSNLKAANEELETLFAKSFGLSIIRIFPYTAADLASNLTASQRDDLQKISPTGFVK
ncbi:MAG: recombination-associated protein RdgC [Deltaproteobacteria bacterium]|jgi:DNA recombination-dependent growth factor C|nr:recombination-associated protein RdgC [Deltaproteobacteria bacterium]MBW2478888.1 recombination-associated protein RdgC [Deltaproteobacteria bacterium]